MTQQPHVRPPSDAGSDTFERYAYQAFVALPILVACGLGEGVRAVYAEHWEDVAVELEAGWRFLQIKTRDPGLGPWRLSHLCEDGGALLSLLRTFREVGDLECTLEAHLEGAVSSRDTVLAKLVARDDGYLEVAVPALCAGLGIDRGLAGSFASALRVIPDHPSRDVIRDAAVATLGQLSPGSSHAVLCKVRDALWAEFATAMCAVPSGSRYPSIVLNPSARSRHDEAIVTAKRLSRERLAPLLAPVVVPARALIRRIVSDKPSPSQLERKLLAGGASPEVVEDALSLRANACILEFELLGGAATPERLLTDLRERLLITARASIAAAVGPRPANDAWRSLIGALRTAPATLDPDSLFQADPFLLLGELCELSDQCLLAWGTAS